MLDIQHMATAIMADQPHDIANKVLRRAQVSKMTRVLQERLALANIKIKNGWQNLSINSIEPELDVKIKRKRSNSHNDVLSDSSSSPSDHHLPASMLNSSPLIGAMFSQMSAPQSDNSRGEWKRPRHNPTQTFSGSGSRVRRQARSGRAATASWKSAHHLAQSSPVRRYQRRAVTLPEAHNVSFASEISTIPNDPDSPSASEDDDSDLPIHSFQFPPSSQFASSPPRTPPPGLARSARLRAQPFSSPPSDNAQAGKEGADLLLYLAASPSPAMRVTRTEMFPPSTPPAKNTPLPSSMMSTPGGQMYLGFGTPGNFNFHDFVNVTPSPAQATWNKTPGTTKTPNIARDVRRRSNLDVPSGVTDSPNPMHSTRSSAKTTGLGMELGGELVV